MNFKKYIYVVCEEYSCEHLYFKNFINRNRDEVKLVLKFLNNTLTFNDTDDKYEIFKRKIKVLFRDLDVNVDEGVWILINTEDNFDVDKIRETIDNIDAEGCFHLFSNPNFRIWLDCIDESLNYANIETEDSISLIKDKERTINAIKQMEKRNCENEADGIDIPGFNYSEIHKLMKEIVKLKW